MQNAFNPPNLEPISIFRVRDGAYLGAFLDGGRRRVLDVHQAKDSITGVAAMAILAAWKKGERRAVRLANLAIRAVERKAKPLSEHKKRG